MDAFVEKPEGGGLSEGRLTVDSAIVFIPYASVLATATHLRLPLDSVEELSLQRILSTLPSTRSAVCLVRVSFVSSPSAEQLNLLLPTASEAEFLSLLGKSLSALGKSLKESPGSSGKYTVTSSVNPPPPNATVPTRGGPASKIHGHVTGLLTNVLGAPLTASLEDAGWTVLESFAKVTHAARNTAVAAIEHPLAQPLVPLVPRRIRSLVERSSNELNRLLGEYETAIEFLAKDNRAQSSLTGAKVKPLDRGAQLSSIMEIRLVPVLAEYSALTSIEPEEWISLRDSEGRLVKTEQELRNLIALRGLHEDIRVDAWKFLLKLFPWDSTEAERATILAEKDSLYKELKADWRRILDAYIASNPRAASSPIALDNRDNAADENDEPQETKEVKMLERRHRILKDVVRTDRQETFFGAVHDGGEIQPLAESPGGTIDLPPKLQVLFDILMTYTMVQFDLGYVQGMNDLLAPILLVMDSESEAFWCFTNWMEVMHVNFERDQEGMRKQLEELKLLIKFLDPVLFLHLETNECDNLFICFRWLLVYFKREFSMEFIVSLWERLWASSNPRMHLFFAFSILHSHRSTLLSLKAFDETLRFVNDLSGNINVTESLARTRLSLDFFRLEIAKDTETAATCCTEEEIEALRTWQLDATPV